MTGEDNVERALERAPDFGRLSAMQRNGGKLADVFDGAVQSEAIGHFRDHAEINMEGARLFEDILQQRWARSAWQKIPHR